MVTRKQKLITVAATLALGIGFTAGGVPVFAHPDGSSSEATSVSSVVKQEQLPFTGYVISIDNHYMYVADTSTKEEALLYQENWWELAYQNKLLKVPVTSHDTYEVGNKLNVFAKAMTKSIPPIAISPTIEKISE
ncbi:DUF3221 domain-containing protein [Paenibacillus larvae]